MQFFPRYGYIYKNLGKLCVFGDYNYEFLGKWGKNVQFRHENNNKHTNVVILHVFFKNIVLILEKLEHKE